VLFVLLRTFNIYGDPRPWAPQKDLVFSVLSFLNTTKYPPSLLYLLMTLGPALLFLYWADDRFKRTEGFFATIGRVPFFYYILHFYVVHIIAVLGVLYAGAPWAFIQLTAQNMAQPEPALLQYG